MNATMPATARVDASHRNGEPTQADIIRGAVAWKNQDVAHHRLMLEFNGNRLIVHAELMGQDVIPTITFLKPFCASFVTELIEAAIRARRPAVVISQVSDALDLIAPDLAILDDESA